MKTMKKALILFGLLVLFSCNQSHESAQGQWIKGSEQEKIDAIERNIGGFGTAMMEVGYRYQELYWAGKDQNWEYAEYQLDDLREAIENGLERRPNRAQSAQHFLDVTLADMEGAIQIRTRRLFVWNLNGCKRAVTIAIRWKRYLLFVSVFRELGCLRSI